MKTLTFGLVTGTAIYFLYAVLGRHTWHPGNLAWCVGCMCVASVLVDGLKGRRPA